MKLAIAILILTTAPAFACESVVVRHPLLPTTTVAFACYSAPVVKPKPKAKKRTKVASYKKRCWYTNKRGQKKYRLRYKCK